MNERKSNKSLYVIVLILCVAVAGLSIAYAALSTTLRINFGTVTQTQQSWNVAFLGSSATGTPTGTSNTGLSCGTATITPEQVTVAATELSKPGDKCVYELTIKNSGTINANLANITPVSPESVSCTNSGASLVCGNITYKLTTDNAGETLLTTNRALGPNDTETVYLTAEFTGDAAVSTAVVQTGAGFTLLYNQA